MEKLKQLEQLPAAIKRNQLIEELGGLSNEEMGQILSRAIGKEFNSKEINDVDYRIIRNLALIELARLDAKSEKTADLESILGAVYKKRAATIEKIKIKEPKEFVADTRGVVHGAPTRREAAHKAIEAGRE